jgi:hypothetical protein
VTNLTGEGKNGVLRLDFAIVALVYGSVSHGAIAEKHP